MDYYTLMLVVDAVSPVKRFQVAKRLVQKIAVGLGVSAAILAIGLGDYIRVRADNSELAALRVEVAEQREQIQNFERTIADSNAALDRVRELERKVRIIANLPGATGIGGAGVTELAPEDPSQLVQPPAGAPVDPGPFGAQWPSTDEPLASPEELAREGLTTTAARHVEDLRILANRVGERAAGRSESLVLLVDELEDKRNKLASMPSVWPTKGWLTSRFGPRISPFTGKRQKHSGIDIAGQPGTPINAPARGRVSSIGHRGPLGNSITLDHGFGVKTFYGHTKEIFVEVGDTVDRGQKIASIGSSGRSTGPHLHYGVHVNGKAQDPLNYIFD